MGGSATIDASERSPVCSVTAATATTKRALPPVQATTRDHWPFLRNMQLYVERVLQKKQTHTKERTISEDRFHEKYIKCRQTGFRAVLMFNIIVSF